MKLPAKILVIEDDLDVLQSARIVLKQHFQEVVTESNPEHLNYLIIHNNFHVILLDMNYAPGETSGKEGFKWLKQILALNPAQEVVLVTAYADVKLAVEAMKLGAADFVVKPWDNEKLVATLMAAFRHSQSKDEIKELKTKNKFISEAYVETQQPVVGNSRAMQEITATVNKIADTDANVLILGENGTGKELVAKSIHHKSHRNNEPFIKVDVGAISASLFESEMFGHVKGAFTDAREDRIGRFELAHGGTVFLDEIGNIPISLQSKLLTVLQNREIVRLGSNKVQAIDIRVVCATNMPLYDLVVKNQFREDLLYRLNTIEIRIPPLRERPEDIPEIVRYYLNFFKNKYRKEVLEISEQAMKALQRSYWKGNVRELQHVVERAVIMCDHQKLTEADFLIQRNNYASADTSFNLEEIEKRTIVEAIKKNGGNMKKTATELGLGRTTLYRKMKKYGL
ncbi:sigma-54 dependent transcriptional regulator [Fulvivirgaceae bacterium BMA12]|uniref:Sigma-54 dependent transcriptional regulator n=1 Tax=Agaribacillus aureus TaxID=3051825 RepID=A0ABT8L820_9BACT|nr:sigma-54 dependent transcriptional regulator [Fulvivirgaceae bacterium BMA12]